MKVISAFLSTLLYAPVLAAQVSVHVIDTGPGLATVIELPDNQYIVYDTGHWNETDVVMDRIEDIIPAGRLIDILVLSHTDSDHIGATSDILERYHIDKVIRTGLERSSNTWRGVDKHIRLSAAAGELVDINLAEKELAPGTSYLFGGAMVTFLAGFTRPPADWDIQDTSEYNNAGSIVMRLSYRGSSVLLMGDAVGRHNGGPANQLIATEKFLVDNSDSLVIDSDVLVASHHGADNGSATRFIQAVSPEWVIFSAGHDHEHPRASTAQRFLNFGVDIDNILRTDLGDDENDPREWDHGQINNQVDQAGDDHIEITISRAGDLTVTQ